MEDSLEHNNGPLKTLKTILYIVAKIQGENRLQGKSNIWGVSSFDLTDFQANFDKKPRSQVALQLD